MDDHLRLVLASAYYKVALIQGNPNGPSLQDFEGADKDLLKADSLLVPAYRRAPDDKAMMMRSIEIDSARADLMYRNGFRDKAVKLNEALLPVARRLGQDPACDAACQMQEANIENNLSIELVSDDPARALEYADQGIRASRRLVALYPGSSSLKQTLGSVTAAGAAAYLTMGELEKGATITGNRSMLVKICYVPIQIIQRSAVAFWLSAETMQRCRAFRGR
jgi:hypothetical protein